MVTFWCFLGDHWPCLVRVYIYVIVSQRKYYCIFLKSLTFWEMFSTDHRVMAHLPWELQRILNTDTIWRKFHRYLWVTSQIVKVTSAIFQISNSVSKWQIIVVFLILKMKQAFAYRIKCKLVRGLQISPLFSPLTAIKMRVSRLCSARSPLGTVGV